MPQTQDGYQIEQDQIAQFERAYELRRGLCRLRSYRSREKEFNALQRINPEMIDEMNKTVTNGHAHRAPLLKGMRRIGLLV